MESQQYFTQIRFLVNIEKGKTFSLCFENCMMSLHRGGSGEGQVVLAVFCDMKVQCQCSSTSVMMEIAQEKVLRSFQRNRL